MKLIMKSIYLFLFGTYIEYHKCRLERLAGKLLKHENTITCRRLVRLSNKIYSLYSKFDECEKSLLCDMRVFNLSEHSI